jgi:tetratricopeptide (TPR) repeat protein
MTSIKPTICLNMIVKNESKIITRLFDSIVSFIDCYCICDTGSTDNTVEIIKQYFERKNIPGKIVFEPFKNFAHNRNFALQSCLYMSNYVLLMDADMLLNIRDFDKSSLTGDAYFILQGTEDFYYNNVRIVKNNGLFIYAGVTHEYLNTPPNTETIPIPKSKLFIVDVGDGGSKSDKYERDIRLLTKGIEDEPYMADRYHFYLANSYFDLGRFEEAIPIYLKRIELKGWEQEVWYSYYRVGLSYKSLGKMEQAIYYWNLAYEAFPLRLENFYEIIHYYREIGKQKLAFLYYQTAMQISNKITNKDSYLFLYNDVYVYKILFEYIIIAYYIGITNVNKEAMTVFNNSYDFNIINCTLTNMKFYKDNLKAIRTIDMSKTIHFDTGDKKIRKYYSSSSCIIPFGNNEYAMNVRYVNYYITPQGGYLDCDDHIITINTFLELDSDLKIQKETLIPSRYDGRQYIGTEDIRIFKKNDKSRKIHFIATGLHQAGNLGIVVGDYKTDAMEYKEIRPAFANNECEKNWVYFMYQGELAVVYNWTPLIVGKINKSNPNNYTLDAIKINDNMPKVFRIARGSTNGFEYQNEIWFVVHIVSYESPRCYYHMLCVFDKEMNFLRNSHLFKFEEEAIEFCLGLIVEENRVLITYSTWDRTTKIGIYDKKYIDEITCFK